MCKRKLPLIWGFLISCTARFRVAQICAVLWIGVGAAAYAQTAIETAPLAPLNNAAGETEYLQAPAAQLKFLDRLAGTVETVNMAVGSTKPLGKLQIKLADCRFPEDNPTGEAFAFLQITEAGEDRFQGWMIASSPALSALDHPRYDVWVLRCNKS